MPSERRFWPVPHIVLATTAVERGGVWKNVVDLATSFRSSGYTVRIAFPDEAPELRADAHRLGFDTTSLRESTCTGGNIWHLHLPKPFDRRTLPMLAAARLRGHRVFVTEHLPRHPSSDDSVPWGAAHVAGIRKPGARHVKTAVKRTEAAIADRVIAVSENSKKFIVNRFGLDPQQCTVVLNGVTYSAATPLPDFDQGLRVAVIGAIAWKKGHDVLIEAALRSQGRWTVDVFGTGAQLDDLRRQARATEGRVVFHGWSDHTAEELDRRHLLCMPSRFEQLPYAVTEAMMRGRPVIATDVDGIPEAVEDGVSGRLVAPGDPTALAAALDFAAANPDAVQGWATAAHARTKEKFAMRAMTDRVLELYCTALSKTGASAREQ